MVHILPCVRSTRGFGALRIWHLALLVLYVAVAIVDLRDQRNAGRVLLGLAAGGYAGYAVLACLGWRLSGRIRSRLHPMAGLVLYLVAMALLFLLAAIVYVAIENAYRMGHF